MEIMIRAGSSKLKVESCMSAIFLAGLKDNEYPVSGIWYPASSVESLRFGSLFFPLSLQL